MESGKSVSWETDQSEELTENRLGKDKQRQGQYQKL